MSSAFSSDRYSSPPPLPGRGLYRSRQGAIFGVCRGFAEKNDLPVFWVRALTVGVTLITGVWPGVIVYLLAAMIIKPEPAVPFRDTADREFYDSYANSRTNALDRLRRVAETLERRTRRLESLVLDREKDWERRFGS